MGTSGSRAAAARRRYRRRRTVVVLVLVAIIALIVSVSGGSGKGRADTADRSPLATLQDQIVSIAQGQIGYQTNPANSYCNKYSSYWKTGADDCGNGLLSEEWCSDFAAWVWQKAGALVVYRDQPGDINQASASFYLWGVRHGTWHEASSGYRPRPGDVAVYGLDRTALIAQHVAIVTNYTPGERGPDVVNGDGSRTGYSVVESGHDQVDADIQGPGGRVSGYVSPTEG